MALAWLGTSDPAAAKPAINAAIRKILRIHASLSSHLDSVTQ
jgi:hypothetical protein